jgi:hypothetical protein
MMTGFTTYRVNYLMTMGGTPLRTLQQLVQRQNILSSNCNQQEKYKKNKTKQNKAKQQSEMTRL